MKRYTKKEAIAVVVKCAEKYRKELTYKAKKTDWSSIVFPEHFEYLSIQND